VAVRCIEQDVAATALGSKPEGVKPGLPFAFDPEVLVDCRRPLVARPERVVHRSASHFEFLQWWWREILRWRRRDDDVVQQRDTLRNARVDAQRAAPDALVQCDHSGNAADRNQQRRPESSQAEACH
jgi:hypothetical protein